MSILMGKCHLMSNTQLLINTQWEDVSARRSLSNAYKQSSWQKTCTCTNCIKCVVLETEAALDTSTWKRIALRGDKTCVTLFNLHWWLNT